MELADVFVFMEQSTIADVKDFIKEYLKGYSSMDSFYEYPKYGAETIYEADSYEDMLEYIFSKPGRSYTFYFENKEHANIKQAIIQINKDGSLCLCLSVTPDFEKVMHDELVSKYISYRVFVSYNQTLPNSILEMERMI